MAKRIEMIAPFAAARGNLSGQQDLYYNPNKSKAYESKMNNLNYAKNYKTRYIGAVRSSDGLAYFQVRTKTANRLDSESQLNMALLGGAGAIYGAYRVTNPTMLDVFVNTGKQRGLIGESVTTRQFFTIQIRQMLAQKVDRLSAILPGPGAISFTLQNPWVKDSDLDISISESTLSRFWLELANDAIIVTITGFGLKYKCLAKSGTDWGELVDSNYNVLGLTSVEETHGGVTKVFIKLGSLYLQGAVAVPGEAPHWSYMRDDSDIETEAIYRFTDIVPEQ